MTPAPAAAPAASADCVLLGSWSWKLAGDAAAAAGLRFPARSDAETWLGETWRDLRAGGVSAAELHDPDGRPVAAHDLREPRPL